MRRASTAAGAGLLLALSTGVAAAADICDPLREHIEFQIANTGVTGFAVIVVDADDEVQGKVVGTCAHGSRKLVYVKADTLHRPAKPRPPEIRAGHSRVITECRDGTVVQGSTSCPP